MPELYPGQTEVVRQKLTEAELLLQANQETLRATDDPEKRANILRIIAGQSGTIGSFKRQLATCEAESDPRRNEDIRVHLSATEKAQVQADAKAAGMLLGRYVRSRLGLT